MAKHDVFISYARADYQDENKNVIPGNAISKIKSALDENKISYWIDEKGIYSGDNFAPIIGKAIRESSVFVYVSSKLSNVSRWAQSEVSVANSSKIPIIPIRIDESDYADNIVMYLTLLDFCDYHANSTKAINKLVKSVKEKLPKKESDKGEKPEEKYQNEVVSGIHNISSQLFDVSQIVVNKLLSSNEKLMEELKNDGAISRKVFDDSNDILRKQIQLQDEEARSLHESLGKLYDEQRTTNQLLETLVKKLSEFQGIINDSNNQPTNVGPGPKTSVKIIDGIKFYDLGLPSGDLWSEPLRKEDGKYFLMPYDMAEKQGIPTRKQYLEFRKNCHKVDDKFYGANGVAYDYDESGFYWLNDGKIVEAKYYKTFGYDVSGWVIKNGIFKGTLQRVIIVKSKDK